MIYEYACVECGWLQDEVRSIADRDLSPFCDQCAGDTKRNLYPHRKRVVDKAGVFPGSRTITTPITAPNGVCEYSDYRAVDRMMEENCIEWVPDSSPPENIDYGAYEKVQKERDD